MGEPRGAMIDVIESYKRVSREPGFMDRFYERFMASHPDVAARFDGVDMERQRFLVGRSVTMILQHASGADHVIPSLTETARRHGPRDLDIPAYLYDRWIESLIETVAEFDPGFRPELERAWRDLLRREVAWFLDAGRAD
jgi:hemoglobin-like flavoprotein